MPKKVLFLLPYPLHKAPSQRFRIEAFLPYLKNADIVFNTQTFLSEKGWKNLYKNGSLFQKGTAVISGFLRRAFSIFFTAWQYDYVVVHREASPLGPPVFEWLLAKFWRKRIIFDFDDAIWIPAISEGNKWAVSVKCFWKTKWICKWAYKIAAGNNYLASFAAQYNTNVVVMPTCVDTQNRYTLLVNQQTAKPVIGWTGSHSTLKYLDLMVPVLSRLERELDFEFLVICNQPPDFDLKSLRFREWKEETEIQDLSQIHIGVMPLIEDAWSKGKCGFKIIQYLALGIPAVASPVGVNTELVEPRINGFLCNTEKEWENALKELLQHNSERASMGQAGQKKILAQFSVQSRINTFLDLFS